MVKVARLNFTGSFENGFDISFQISEHEKFSFVGTTGKLPANSRLPQIYDQWRQNYSHYSRRLKKNINSPPSQYSIKELKRKIIQGLDSELNEWLDHTAFRDVVDSLIQEISRNDEILILMQTPNHNSLENYRIPWGLWNRLNKYPKAEIALSSQHFQNNPIPPDAQKTKLKVLAVLGGDKNINVQVDKDSLANLKKSDVTFLEKPDLRTLTRYLRQGEWDIFCFSGHSETDKNNAQGMLDISDTETINISDLNSAFRKAIGKGLKLAIFNSCDGLGIAQDLMDFQIPQVIVMREPVPDQVAQDFLECLLEELETQPLLPFAFREARESLEGLGNQYLGASWFPVLFLHPVYASLPLFKVAQASPVLNDFVKNIKFRYGHLENLVTGERDRQWEWLQFRTEEELNQEDREILELLFSFCCYFKKGKFVPISQYKNYSTNHYYLKLQELSQQHKLGTTEHKLSEIVQDESLARILRGME